MKQQVEQLSFLDDNQNAGAIIVDCYRYSLWRIWDEQLPRVLFIMLNPSTADHRQDDPTLKRCKSFAKSWGYGSLEVVNLFAYRSAYPSDLLKASDPVGPENDQHIVQAVGRAARIIAAWGADGALYDRNVAVIQLVRTQTDELLHCLGETKDRHPRHPLYLPAGLQPQVYG